MTYVYTPSPSGDGWVKIFLPPGMGGIDGKGWEVTTEENSL